MKILQIGYLDPYNNFGGVEKYIYNLSTGLHKQMDYEVDVLVAGTVNNSKELEFGKIITLKVPFFNSKLFFLAKYLYARKVRKIVNIMAHEYDILHFHGDNGFIDSNFASKTVLTVHGVADNNSSIVKRITSFLPSRIERNNVMKARIVFSMSKDAAEFFAKLSRSQIKIIKQSVDTDFYRALPKEEILSIKKELGFPEESQHNVIIGLIIGTDPVRKGLNTAIRAIEGVKETNVMLASIGFPPITLDTPRYKHVGKVDDRTKLKYLQIADFFILPSRKEGFPISVLEAAEVGLPLIVSKNCGVSELKTLVPYLDEVDSLEPEPYKTAIEIFIKFHEKERDMNFIQDRNLRKQYSISTVVKIYSDAYKSLLGNV